MPALPSITARLEARMQYQHRGAQRISTYLDLILNIKGFDQPKPHLFFYVVTFVNIYKHLQCKNVEVQMIKAVEWFRQSRVCTVKPNFP